MREVLSSKANEAWIPPEAWGGSLVLENVDSDSNYLNTANTSSRRMSIEVQVRPSPRLLFTHGGRSYAVAGVGEQFALQLYGDTPVTFQVKEFGINYPPQERLDRSAPLGVIFGPLGPPVDQALLIQVFQIQI